MDSAIFLNQILLGNINNAGLDTRPNVMGVMVIPAIGMLIGLLIALFIVNVKLCPYIISQWRQWLFK